MRSRACSRVEVICLATLLAAVPLSCQSREPSPLPAVTPTVVSDPAATQSAAAPVQIEMMNVRLHLDSGVVLNIRRLRGEMVSQAQTPPVFDNPRSYVLRVFSGDLSLSMTSLTNLMNRHVFAYEGAPLKDISVEVDEGKLRQHGKIHQGVWVPFEMRASPGATRDGRLVFHTESVSALGVPTTKLLDLFGLT